MERKNLNSNFRLPDSETSYVWQRVCGTKALQSMTNDSFLGSSYWMVYLADGIEYTKAGWGF